MKPWFRYADIIHPPPADHVWGTIPRRWVTYDELEGMRRTEEFELYDDLLMRINYWPQGLRVNKHFRIAHDNTLKFLEEK